MFVLASDCRPVYTASSPVHAGIGSRKEKMIWLMDYSIDSKFIVNKFDTQLIALVKCNDFFSGFCLHLWDLTLGLFQLRSDL